jgi:hypothetical protein
LTARDAAELRFIHVDRDLERGWDQHHDRGLRPDQRARRDLAIEDHPVDRRRDLGFPYPELGQLERRLGLVDSRLSRLQIGLGIRVLAAAQLGLGLSDDVLLLFDVIRGVGLLRLLQLLARLLDQRPLRLDVLLRGRPGGDRQLLLRLVDRVLGGLDFLIPRAGDDLGEPRLVGVELLARGIHLGLGRLALRVLAATRECPEAGLGGLQVLLDTGDLRLGLVLLRLDLRPLGVDLATLHRVEAGLSHLDLLVGRREHRLGLALAGWQPTSLEEVELRLGRRWG